MLWLTVIALLAIYSYICWRSVKSGLLVLLGALPLYLVKLEVFFVPTTLLELMFGIVFLFWLFKCARQFVATKEKWKPKSLITIQTITAIIILGALLSLMQASDIQSSINAIKSFLIEPIIVAIMIWSVTQDKKLNLKPWILALAVPTTLISLYAIFQYFTGFGIPDAWFLERRVTSIFPYPNALGHFVAPIVTLNIVWLMKRGLKRLGGFEFVLIASTALGIIALFLSKTEAAWVAIAVTVVLAGILISRKRKIWITIALFGAILAIAIPQARQKLLLQDWSGQTRLTQWEETWNFLTYSPRNFLLGAGANNYPNAIEPFHEHEYLEIFQQPHNIFLNVWVEYGLIGLVGFVALAILLITKKDILSNASAIVLLAALTEMTIHGLVDVPYFKNDLSILTWVIIALLAISAYDD